jgi:hypothetical protein
MKSASGRCSSSGGLVFTAAVLACPGCEYHGLLALGLHQTDTAQGNVYLTSQSGVDAMEGVRRIEPCDDVKWPGMCAGDLEVGKGRSVDLPWEEEEEFSTTYRDLFPTITSLDGLGDLEEVAGAVRVQHTLLELAGTGKGPWKALRVGGELSVRRNSTLQSLSWLDGVREVGGRLAVESNDVLVSTAGIGVTSVGGDLRVASNPVLQRLEGFPNLLRVDGDLFILGNPELRHISLGEFQLGGRLFIDSNPRLHKPDLEALLRAVCRGDVACADIVGFLGNGDAAFLPAPPVEADQVGEPWTGTSAGGWPPVAVATDGVFMVDGVSLHWIPEDPSHSWDTSFDFPPVLLAASSDSAFVRVGTLVKKCRSDGGCSDFFDSAFSPTVGRAAAGGGWFFWAGGPTVTACEEGCVQGTVVPLGSGDVHALSADDGGVLYAWQGSTIYRWKENSTIVAVATGLVERSWGFSAHLASDDRGVAWSQSFRIHGSSCSEAPCTTTPLMDSFTMVPTWIALRDDALYWVDESVNQVLCAVRSTSGPAYPVSATGPIPGGAAVTWVGVTSASLYWTTTLQTANPSTLFRAPRPTCTEPE